MEMYVKLTLKVWREADQWLGECQELGTATFGDTFEEAKQALEEAVQLNLEGLSETGELCRFLEENRIRVYRHRPLMFRSRLWERFTPGRTTKLVTVPC